MTSAKSRYQAKYRHRHHNSIFHEKKLNDYSTTLLAYFPDDGLNGKMLTRYQMLVDCWLPYIKTLVNRCYDRTGLREDLKQIGLISLWDLVIRNPDLPEKNLIKLGNVAIREKIFTALYQENLIIEGKGHLNVNRRFQRAQKRFNRKFNRYPTAKELSKITKISLPNVIHWLIKDSHIHEGVLNWDSPYDRAWILKNRNYFWERKTDLENRLIYWIDRRWVKKAVMRLDKKHRQAVKAHISDRAMTVWAKRLNVKYETFCFRRNQAFQLLRNMADLKYDLNAPVSPKEFLRRKGYKSLYRGKKMPTVDDQY